MQTIIVKGMGAETSEGFEHLRVTLKGVNDQTKADETVYAVFQKPQFFSFANILNKCTIETKAYEAHVLTDAAARSAKKSVFEAMTVQGGPMEGDRKAIIITTLDGQVLLLSLQDKLVDQLQSLLSKPQSPAK
jgi:hypothetical protein